MLNNCIANIFTSPIYCRDKINPPTKDKLKMLSLFGELTKKPAVIDNSQNIFYGVEGDITSFKREELKWLNKQVTINSKIYLNDLGVDTKLTKLNIEKAKPSICYNKGGKLKYNKNTNSHITALYCLQSDFDNDSGKIVFYRDNKLIRNVSYDLEDCNGRRLAGIALKSSISLFSGRLIIIPSNIDYEILPYYGKKHRFFITYGLSLPLQ